MKVLLHNPIMHRFLRRPGDWTLDADEAMEFDHISDAVNFSHEHDLSGIQVFLKFENPIDTPAGREEITSFENIAERV
jgi:hypothetical protein